MTKSVQVFLAAVVVLACVVAGLLVYRSVQMAEPSPVVLRSPEEIRQSWQDGVRGVIAVYEQEQNAVQARDQLLRLTVPAEKRDAHLALVLALEAAVQGRSDAAERWTRAKVLIDSL